jgi:hypothetical protein
MGLVESGTDQSVERKDCSAGVRSRSNTGIVGSDPTQGMDVCVYSVYVLGSGLATG